VHKEPLNPLYQKEIQTQVKKNLHSKGYAQALEKQGLQGTHENEGLKSSDRPDRPRGLSGYPNTAA
jgi:hypothetical protein